MATQTASGKAFEYALSKEAYIQLSQFQKIILIEDDSLKVAQKCFNGFSNEKQSDYINAAKVAIKHLLELEPYLSLVSEKNTLSIKIAADSAGKRGDVRDILFIRSNEGWEIGISAKHNHKAVKHSRLSSQIDFGKEWLGIPCSSEYFEAIKPIFSELNLIKKENKKWKDIPNKNQRFYVPILQEFKKELIRLNDSHGSVPSHLIKYLLGNNDFYKVIKSSGQIEFFGFNLSSTLNKQTPNNKSLFFVPKLKLPSRIIELTMKEGSSTTLVLTFDQGWQISFRIHNASTFVEPSLKFDINLLGQPQSLYSHHIPY